MKIENLKLKIVFFGASKFVLPAIKMLHENFELCMVVTTERNPEDAVPSFCEKNNIPYLAIEKFDTPTIDQIKKENGVLGVLAYFGLFLPNEVLEIFPKGILNIHPSLLPQYRGPTPVQSALLDGEVETGVTIIKLDKEMDHGPILDQAKEKVKQDDTTPLLHERLFTKGAEMLEKIIPEYLNGELKPIEQNHNDATFSKKDLTRMDGFFDIDNPPDKQTLDRMIRALSPWPGAWTKARIENKELRIKFLPNKRLQVEGGKEMDVKDFLNGYPTLKELVERTLEL